MSYAQHFAIFMQAVELLKSNPYHDLITAATILHRSKTICSFKVLLFQSTPPRGGRPPVKNGVI